jgi:CheY-like chemotaxis protein
MTDKPKVLVIDPNPYSRKITEGYLRLSSDWQMKAVATLDQAFTDICFWEPQIAICTEKISGGTVFDLLSKCQQASSSLPPFGMIVCLAQPSKATILQLRHAGRPLVLRTPFSRSELESRLAFVMAHLSNKGTLLNFDSDAASDGNNTVCSHDLLASMLSGMSE